MKKSLLLIGMMFLYVTSFSQTYTFTNAGATGNTGPTQSQANTAYTGTDLDGQVTVLSGIQYWEVPASGLYEIQGMGGQGYGPFGGRGASITGEFFLNAGDTLKILVGQQAGDYKDFPLTTYDQQFGGGGGSFITYTDNIPLIVAGGGGGSHATSYITTSDGQTSTSGEAGVNGSTVGAGGTAGQGGLQASSADAGAGLLGDGDGTAGGEAFINGGLGGIDEGTGGFGGGGGTSSYNNFRGGGGGGYSGGGGSNNGTTCCPSAGGGGSFNAGNNPVDIAGVHTGDGQVIITALSTGAEDDAGVISIGQVTVSECPTSMPVTATIQNFGGNQINSITVNWSVDGVLQTPVSNTSTLDTIGGTGSITANVALGNYTFSSGNHTVIAWTTNPNGNVDTVGVNDSTTSVQTPIGPPQGLAVSNITSSGADVSWTSSGANSYNIIYGPKGFDPATGGQTSSSTTSPATLSLNPGTSYDVYLVGDCGSGAFSDTAGPEGFNTLCVALTSALTLPFTEDFENYVGPSLINGDSVFICTPTYSWSFLEADASGELLTTSSSDPAHSGTNAAIIAGGSGAAGVQNDLILSINLSAYDTTDAFDKVLEFYFQDFADEADPEDRVSLRGDVSEPWVEIYDWSTLNSSNWEEVKVNLTAALKAANQNFSDSTQIRWSQNDNATLSGGDGFGLDDVGIEEVSCFQINNVSFNNINFESGQVVLSGEPGNTAFNILWGPCGFNQASPSVQTATGTDSIVMNNLVPSTCYEVYVIKNCTGASNGYSDTTGPFTFTSGCLLTAPITEDFENGFSTGASGPNISPCLASVRTTDPNWEVENASGANENTSNTGPFYDNTDFGNSGGYYLYLETTSGSAGDADTLTTVPIDITFLNDPYLSFAYHMYGSDMGDMEVEVFDSGAWSNITTISGQQQSAGSSLWKIFGDTLTGLVDDTIRIRVIGIRGSGGEGDMSIDDFQLIDAPTCVSSRLLTVISDSTSTSSTTVTWVPGAGGKYEVEYGLPGFIPGVGAIGTATVTDTFYTITGLTQQTSYDVYVRDSCAGGYSGYVGPVSFTTDCNLKSLPYFEGFTSGSFPACWSRSNTTDVTHLSTCDSRNDVIEIVYTKEAITPVIDVSSATSLEVSYLIGAGACTNDPEDAEHFYVEYWDGTQWILAMDHDGSLPQSFVQQSFLIPPGGFSTDFRVRFNMIDGTTDAWQIDDVEVKQGPTCFDPLQLGVNNLVDTSTVLTWIGSPGATSYEVWFGPAGFYQGSQTIPGTGTRITTPYDSLLIDTLSPNTCYEFGVRGFCGPNDSTAWTSGYSFCTPCSAITAPHFENFDATTEPNIDPCWTLLDDATSTYDFVGTENLYSFSSPNSVEFYNYPGSELLAVTPLLGDFDNLKRIRIQVYDDGFNDSDLLIGTMSNPSDASTFTPYDTIFDADMEEDAWKEFKIFFGNYSGTDQYVAFKHGDNVSYDHIYFDNFIYEEPTCFDPTNFTFDANTSTSIDFSWVTGGATAWQIEYGPIGFTPGTGTLVNVNTNPYTLSGLPSGHAYDVYVRDSCGLGDVGLWVGPIVANTSCSPLVAGTYTIGGATPDYATFEDAAEALNVCGVAGPVTFNIQPGTYTERLHLRGIPGLYAGVPGVSSTNTITFNSSGSDTLIWDGSGPQAAVLLDSTSHVTFNGMTIMNTYSTEAWGILVTQNSDNVTIDSCTIIMDSTSTSGDRTGVIITGSYEDDLVADAEVDSLTLTNSTIIGGYYGVALQGNGTSDLSLGHIVSNNVIRGYYYYGIDLDDLEKVTITDNRIRASASASTGADGIYAYDVSDYTIEGNYVHTPDYGLYLYDGNDGFTPSAFSTVVNNMIISTTGYGIYLYDAVKTDVYHNTAVGGPAFAINDDEDLNIMNNIFVTDGDFAFESVDAIDATTLVDYNLYFKTGSGDPFDDGSSTYSDLSAWQTGDATRNVNSLEGNPVFTSPEDLHLIGGLANDAGDNSVGITVDIDGDTRPASGATSVDIGADEYTPPAGDLSLLDASFIKGLCLSANDSIEFMIKNLVSPVDFSQDPLTVKYDVTGPANTSGSLIINSGAPAILDTVIAYAGSIDLSIPGTYTLLAYLEPNSVNVFDNNDTLDVITLKVDSEFVAQPSVVTLPSANDSAEICVKSAFFGGGQFMITEQSHYDYSVGRPSPDFPAYLVADDYIEITGRPGSDLGGITLEQWEGSAIVNSFTFSSGTVLSPDGTAIIAVGQDRSSTPSPADFYYHGDVSHTWGSGDNSGRVLKDASGNVIDAVGYGTYTFPAGSGVTASDWSGTTGSATTTAGVRLIGPDINDGSNWVVSSSANTQDPNTVNAGVVVPAGIATGLTWTLNGIQVDTTACTMAGPFSGPGTYKYFANFSNGCGTFTDSVIVIVPNCSAPSGLSGTTVSTSSVSVSWDTTGTGASSFDVEYGAVGFTPGNGTLVNVPGDSTEVTGLPINLCQDFYVRARCSATDNSIWIGPISVCPDETICTDSIEQYDVALIEGQSALFIPWEGAAGNGGTASVTTAQASSGSQSIRFSNATGNAADHDDIVAYFDTINSGRWEIAFDLYVPSNKNAYFNIQQNHDLIGTSHLYGGEIYFQGNGVAEVQHGTTVAGTFNYTQGQWNRVSTIIDLAGDSIWFQLNGTTTGVGFNYSVSNGLPLQFNAVDFFTGKLATDNTSSEFYIDDFCVSPYSIPGVCSAPTGLAANNLGCDSAVVSWNSTSGNNSSILEYGPVGFTPGTAAGTVVNFINSPYTIAGLAPGTAYDFYVSDTCATDTSALAGPFAFVTPSGPLPMASFTANISGFNVTFDASASTNASSYSWDFGDGNTGSGVNASNTYATGGTQTIVLTATNACGTDDTTIVLTDIDLLENELQQSLIVYPNPAKDEVNISFDHADGEDVTIRVLDLSGKEIKTWTEQSVNSNFEQTINLGRLADGVYMLKITSGTLNASKRLIKQ